MRKLMFVVLVMAAGTAMAQQIDLKSLDKFADRATKKTQIDIDEATLKSSAGLLKEKKGEEAAAKKSTENLKGLFLRSYEFDKKDAYKLDELKPLLDQLKAPNWTPFLRTKDDGELTEIWMHRTNNEVDGMLLVAAEGKELTVINAMGLTRPEDFSNLKNFGVPNIKE